MGRRLLLDSTSYLLVRVAKAHRDLVSRHLAEIGLHTGQEFVLVQLWHEDGLRHSELAQRMGVAPPTVTKVLGGMQRAGLVTRQRDSRDARSFRVWLTARGRSLREPVEDLWQTLESMSFQSLDDADRHRLQRALAQILANIT